MILQVTSIVFDLGCFVLRDADNQHVLTITPDGNRTARGHQSPLAAEDFITAIEGCDRCGSEGVDLRNVLIEHYPHRFDHIRRDL